MDVDESYLHKKRLRLEESGLVMAPMLPPKSAPLSGWEVVTEANIETIAQKLPYVTFGMINSYLDIHTGREHGEGTFRALSRGYTHWASGHVERIEVKCNNSLYCHVQSVMKPSMRQGSYRIWIVLKCTGQFATVSHARSL